MNNEEVNFEYTLPADINLVESESPVKNRKVKSNGKAKNEDNEQLPECDYNEAFEDNNQNDEFDKSYENMENLEKYKQNYGDEDEIQDENNEEKKEDKIEDKSTKIKVENVNENLNNTNNMTINSQNKYQSKFLSTVNDNSKKMSNPSRLQQAEISYEKVQMKMNKIFEEDEKLEKLEEKKDYEVLSDVYIQQNLKLIKNLEEFSQILNILIEATRFTAKKQEIEKKENPKKKKKKVINPPINEGNTSSENKLVEVFKIEYNRLKGRVEQLNGLNYEENLLEKSKEMSNEITLIETENKSLKLSQKQSEAKFERQGKNPKESNVDLKKASADYMNFRILNEQLIEKVQKNKIEIEENEKKLNDLNTKFEKNKEIAENYGITEEVMNKKCENTGKILSEESKQKESLRVSMLKKCEVLEKVSLSNKKKYEAEIARNIKSIFNLENNIRELYSVHSHKSKTAYLNNMKFSELYDMYNATTSSTINSNLKEPTKNNLVKMNEQINNRQTLEKQIISPNSIKEKKRSEKENYDKAKPLPKIKSNHQQDQIKKKVKTEKIRNLEIKNKDPSIEPDNDDTYFTNVSPLMVKPVVNDKDKALHESVLKAKEFIKGIQNSSHGNLHSLDGGQSVCEYKVENTEKNFIHNVDDEPISEMLKKYENLNNKISIKNNDLIIEEIDSNSEKNKPILNENENVTKNNIHNDRNIGFNETKNGHNPEKNSINNKNVDLNPNTFKAAISGEILGSSNEINDFKIHSSFEFNNKQSIKDKNLLVQINKEGNYFEQKKISVKNNNDLDDLIL
jgi:hypothetical protein